MIRGAIFDLDGTLLDSMALWRNLGERYLESMGCTPRESLPKKLQTMSLMEAAAYFRTGYGIALSEHEILEGIKAMVANAYRNTLQLKPGVSEFLQFLQEHHVVMYLATANDRELVEAALTRCGVWQYFAGLITCEEAGAGKKQPDIYEKALAALGTPKEATVVFEDASHAGQTAKAAGFPLAGVYDAHSKNSEELSRISDYYIADFRLPEAKEQFL